MLEKAMENNAAVEISHLYREKLTLLEARLQGAQIINLITSLQLVRYQVSLSGWRWGSLNSKITPKYAY